MSKSYSVYFKQSPEEIAESLFRSAGLDKQIQKVHHDRLWASVERLINPQPFSLAKLVLGIVVSTLVILALVWVLI